MYPLPFAVRELRTAQARLDTFERAGFDDAVIECLLTAVASAERRVARQVRDIGHGVVCGGSVFGFDSEDRFVHLHLGAQR